MICSCHATIVCNSQTHVGMQVYRDQPSGDAWLILALFNCVACGSTRAAILHDATGDDDQRLTDLAAE